MPSNESASATRQIHTIAECIAAQVDLERLLQVTVSPHTAAVVPAVVPIRPRQRFRIGLVRDRAFGFYYADDLEALAAGGAEIVPINALDDAHLPALDGLVIGGGFPELFLQELEANASLRHAIHQAVEDGLPVYAECGGLMYLSRSMRWKGRAHQMVGVIPGDVVMHDKPVGRGYVRLRETGLSPWRGGAAPAQEICAHEFHYSNLENLAPNVQFAYEMVRGHGLDGRHDGIVYRNLLASYTHLRSTRNCNWVQRFLALVARHASSRMAAKQAVA